MKIMACFIMTRNIIDHEKYGGISPKPPIFPGHNLTCEFYFSKWFLNKMFIEHIKYNVQSVMTHTPQKPKKAESAGFYYGGKIIDQEKYGRLRPKLSFVTRHNNPE